jgi:hypothetical protein
MSLIRINSEVAIYEDTDQAQCNLIKLVDILQLLYIHLIQDNPFRLQVPKSSSTDN